MHFELLSNLTKTLIVVASGGGTVSNTSHKITFTIGESIVGEIENNDDTVNQRFYPQLLLVVLWLLMSNY